MGGVLVNQDKSVGFFCDNVSIVQNADDAESQFVFCFFGRRGRNRCGLRSRRLFKTGQFQSLLQFRHQTARRVIQKSRFENGVNHGKVFRDRHFLRRYIFRNSLRHMVFLRLRLVHFREGSRGDCFR